MKRAAAGAALLAAAMLALAAPFAILRSLGNAREQEAARGLAKMAAHLVGQAARVGDDLGVQKVLQALSATPHVSYAVLWKPDGKIVASSQPSEVGKALELSRLPRGGRRLAIREGDQVWGHLQLQYARSRQAKSWTRRAGWIAAGQLPFLIISLLIVRGCRRQASELQKAVEDAALLLEEERQSAGRKQRKLDELSRRSQLQIQAAVEASASPFILLDDRQHVLAANASFRSLSGMDARSDGSGKSWAEVSVLAQAGPALEQSLQSPGRRIDHRAGDQGLSLLSVADSSGQIVATSARLS